MIYFSRTLFMFGFMFGFLFSLSSTPLLGTDLKEDAPWHTTQPCLVLLSQDAQKKSCTFQLAGQVCLKKIAQDKRAKNLDGEGFTWSKKFSQSEDKQTWTRSAIRGIEGSTNAYHLSYADLYKFYNTQDQLEEGSAMASLWDIFFVDKASDISAAK